MMNKHTNEDAVSPVIGVILMVAITVILAAVVGAFVFGMAGQMQKSKTIAFTVQRNNATALTVTNMGGQDAGSLMGVNVTINDQPPVTWIDGNSVGATKQYGSADGVTTGRNRVMVVGTFSDTTGEQVILDTYI